ncbi:Protein LSM12 [Candida viswanathii]|uniref:Protein LSM12 n=1 Tax=Candida viswanathii TaxID=5486 RepID=A0A367YIH5_9ASCO|nr:Protein LSM12 [Candida viswanathii]
MSFQTLEQIINLKVRITNLLDQIIVGHIYTYSSSNEIIILKTTDNKEGPSTFRIINTSFIKSIQVLPPFGKKTYLVRKTT